MARRRPNLSQVLGRALGEKLPNGSDRGMGPAAETAATGCGGCTPQDYLPPLEAWLKQKHTDTSVLGKQWARRWVYVHDGSGYLHVCSRPGKDGALTVSARRTISARSPANAPAYASQFSLSEEIDVRSLEPLDPESGGRMFSFVVSQASNSVVLRCIDDNERAWWITQLEKRVQLWRERRRADLDLLADRGIGYGYSECKETAHKPRVVASSRRNSPPTGPTGWLAASPV